MSLRLMLATALFAIASFVAPQISSACDCDGGGFGYYAWNYHRMPLRTGNVPAPPYFALHPPVYYSGIQYRPYGDSPFAYRPRRPEGRMMYYGALAPVSPKLVENPYFRPEGSEPAAGTTGQIIINPYYDADNDQLVKSE